MSAARETGLVLVAEHVHTLDFAGPSPPFTTAIGVLGEVVVAVGSEGEVRALLPNAARVDLGRRTIVPGFSDAHCHWLGYALSRRRLVIPATDSLGDVLMRIRDAAATTQPGEWILGRGWDQSRWARWPLAEDLDSVAPRHPVVLTRKDGHAVWANSSALALARIDAYTPDPAGGEIVRESGIPSGVLKEHATTLLTDAVPVPAAAARMAALQSSWETAWQAGITGCHDMGLGQAAVFRDLARVRDEGTLGLRFVWYAPQAAFDETVALGLRSGLGDSWIRFGGLKVYLDGTLGSQTARLLAPYEGQSGNRGLELMSEDELASVVLRARDAGVAVAAHAIGDAAVRMALDHLGRPGSGYGGHIPDRIEHAQMVHPADLGRFATSGVIASMQPFHAVADAGLADRYWGERAVDAYPWQALANAGAHVVFGSDAPVEDPSVMAGLSAAVNRDGWHPEQAVTVGQALYSYTAGPAQASGQGDLLGSLSPGKLADLVVLSADPFSVAAADLSDLRVEATMIGGAWAWRHSSLDIAGPRLAMSPTRLDGQEP